MVELNDNDNKLLSFCLNKKRSIGEIAKYLNISPKNVSVRVYEKLNKLGLIIIEKGRQGKKTFIQTKKGDKTIKYFITLLKEIKRKGEVTEREYANIIPFDNFDTEQQRFDATLKLRFTSPPLIESVIRLTPEGEEFLKKHSK